MSLFGSMTTAISGLNAQSHALTNIAGNVANSQTTGFKRLDTTFEDLVAQSTRLDYVSGGVAAQNAATTDIQGAIEQVESPLALALGGRGFFSVAKPVSRANDGTVTFDTRQTYSRAGDFSLDRDGYLINSTGYVLNGWLARPDGTLDRSALQPIRISDGGYQPKPTSQLSISANLPANLTAPPATPMSTTMQVYDVLGTQQPLTLDWQQTGAEAWTLTVVGPGETPLGSVDLAFNAAVPGGPPAGTLHALTGTTGALRLEPSASGQPNLVLSTNLGHGAQDIRLDLGRFDNTDGVTQFSGTEYELHTVSQDGAAAGAFSSLAFRQNGDVVANYDNGQSRVVARVPVVTFPAPDALERLDGQAFAATADAGSPQVTEAGRNGAADLNVGAVERSNVDIAAEFSKLIVAQRAYSANTRIVTAADEMLQDTINMRR